MQRLPAKGELERLYLVPDLVFTFYSTPSSYYITAAPQCPYPDANIGDALNEAPFDAVFVQFCKRSFHHVGIAAQRMWALAFFPLADNNYCGLDAPNVSYFIPSPFVNVRG